MGVDNTLALNEKKDKIVDNTGSQKAPEQNTDYRHKTPYLDKKGPPLQGRTKLITADINHDTEYSQHLTAARLA